MELHIDWKEIAKSEGYQSLKARYIKSVNEKHSSRTKDEYYKHFQWVLRRAKHYAKHTGKPLDEILLEWEKGCNCWWLNYYSNQYFPLLTPKNYIPANPVKRAIRLCNAGWNHKEDKLKHVRYEKKRLARQAIKKP